MSVHRKDGSGWVVRWRDKDGRNRSRSFPTKQEATAHDLELKEANRRARERQVIADGMEQALGADAPELHKMAKALRAFADTDWDEVGMTELQMAHLGNRLASALEQRADAMEQGDKVPARYVERDRAAPTTTVESDNAEGRASFLVAEGDPLGGGQRATHSGYFLTIAEADAWRREQPDADALAITVLHDLYPIRDLTSPEVASGELDPVADGTFSATIERIYREASGNRS